MARSPPDTSALPGYDNAPLSQRLAPARAMDAAAKGDVDKLTAGVNDLVVQTIDAQREILVELTRDAPDPNDDMDR